MPLADNSPLPPELGPETLDPRSVHAFWHGFPSPLVRWHFHDEYELHLIVASTGKVFVGDYVGDFEPGQLILLGPRVPHNWVSHVRPGHSIDMRDGVIQFRRELVQSMSTVAPEFERLLPLLERACYGLEFRPSLCEEAETWFNEIIESRGIRRITLLCEVLDRLSHERDCRTLASVLLLPNKRIAMRDKLERAMRYAADHHAGTIKLKSVADLVGMSDSSFSRAFSRATGHSFTHFLNSVRIAHACERLGNTDQPITEICHAVGYNNVANFNRRFKELKGLTPREYRKRARIGHV